MCWDERSIPFGWRGNSWAVTCMGISAANRIKSARPRRCRTRGDPIYSRFGLGLLLAAILPLLLPNGQTFTNTLIALGLAVASVGVTFIGQRRANAKGRERRVCRWIVVGGVGLAM